MKKYLNYFIAILTIILFNWFFKYDLLSASAVGIFAYWVSALVIRTNTSFPIKELFLSLYALQFLFGAALTYNGMDEYNHYDNRMRISSEDYFTYVIPVFLSFCLGFNLFVKKNSIKINRIQIDQWLNAHSQAPYYFIAVGFLISFTLDFIPSSLNFVVYILSGFKFVGLFILLMSFRTIKPMIMALIYGSILISSFQGGMFHDLLIWIIMLSLLLVYRFRPNWILKIVGILVFGLFAIFIQSIKTGLRAQTWTGNKEASISLVEGVTNDVVRSNGGLLSLENLGPNIIRINQGWVLASAIDYVPLNVKHTHGELIWGYVYAAIVPRVFDADKLKSGGHDLVNKYAGREIAGDTSVSLGLFTDAYVDFGPLGAIICVFFFGLFYGYILKQFYVKSKTYPILILFVILAFIYPIRPDTDTGSALGNLFKTIMLLWIIFRLYPNFFKIPSTKNSIQSS
jgi:hypothetical protein